jgi:hypothetical protein
MQGAHNKKLITNLITYLLVLDYYYYVLVSYLIDLIKLDLLRSNSFSNLIQINLIHFYYLLRSK